MYKRQSFFICAGCKGLALTIFLVYVTLVWLLQVKFLLTEICDKTSVSEFELKVSFGHSLLLACLLQSQVHGDITYSYVERFLYG